MPDTPTVLVLNTSQRQPQLGVWQPSGWRYQLDAGSQTSSTVLFQALETAFATIGSRTTTTGLSPQGITDVIVCIGPGSYTGLRTGLSIARTIGQLSPSVRLWPVSQFQLVLPDGAHGWVILPALRQVAYVAWLDESNEAPPGETGKPSYMPQGAVSQDLTVWQPSRSGPVWISDAIPDAFRPPEARLLPREGQALNRAIEWWQQGKLDTTDWSDLSPLYIQPPHITSAR